MLPSVLEPWNLEVEHLDVPFGMARNVTRDATSPTFRTPQLYKPHNNTTSHTFDTHSSASMATSNGNLLKGASS